MLGVGRGRRQPKRKFESFATERREESKARNPTYYAKTTRPFPRREAHFTDGEFRLYKLAPLGDPADDTGETELAFHVPGEASMLGDMIEQPLLLIPTEDGLGFGIQPARVIVLRMGYVAPRGHTGTIWVSGFPRFVANYLLSPARPVRPRDAARARQLAAVAAPDDAMELEEEKAFDGDDNAL